MQVRRGDCIMLITPDGTRRLHIVSTLQEGKKITWQISDHVAGGFYDSKLKDRIVLELQVTEEDDGRS